MERRKPRKKILFLKRMWRKYGFPRIRRTRKYQKLRMKVMGVNRFEKGIIIVSNLIILISFISGVVSGNNWNSTGMRVLSVASLSMNLIILEYMLVVIRNK